VIFIVTVSFLAGYLLSRLIGSYKIEVAAHEQKDADLSRQLGEKDEKQAALIQRIEELEKTGKRCGNPQRTDIGLEDAIAVVMDAQQRKEIANMHFSQEMTYLDARLNAAAGILRKLRGDPHAYDEDAPNGKREIGGTK